MNICHQEATRERDFLNTIQEILKADLEIPRRSTVSKPTFQTEELRNAVYKRKLVYTVFDGDQELMCGLMRHAIMSKGMVPVNPPSVLGYRDTVVRNKVKSDVLLEDVALLQKCDQIWIFHDLENTEGNGTPIPEGALFELLFARHFRPDIEVFTVSPKQLFDGEVTPRPFSLEDVDRLSDKNSVQEITATLRASYPRLPKVRYYYYDPLDFKYGEWVRSFTGAPSTSPLDPMLSIRLLDGQQSLGEVAQSWLALLRLADEVCHVSSLHEQDGDSLWCDLLKEVARRCFSLPCHQLSWNELHVPKALLGSKWPVTSREAEIVLSRTRAERLCA